MIDYLVIFLVSMVPLIELRGAVVISQARGLPVLTSFIICIIGLLLGRKIGNKFSNRAQIFGGVILIAIGVEIFISGMIK